MACARILSTQICCLWTQGVGREQSSLPFIRFQLQHVSWAPGNWWRLLPHSNWELETPTKSMGEHTQLRGFFSSAQIWGSDKLLRIGVTRGTLANFCHKKVPWHLQLSGCSYVLKVFFRDCITWKQNCKTTRSSPGRSLFCSEAFRQDRDDAGKKPRARC